MGVIQAIQKGSGIGGYAEGLQENMIAGWGILRSSKSLMPLKKAMDRGGSKGLQLDLLASYMSFELGKLIQFDCLGLL